MSPEELMAALKPVQEKKGYFFFSDLSWVLDVLGGMLRNKERYGYTSCPCRLATGDRQRDREIVCPCVFREEDVAKFGRCYCQLYVSREVLDGQKEMPEAIPERWLRK